MKNPIFTKINFRSFVKKSCFFYFLLIFSYHSLYILLRSIILFICLNRLYIFFMAMNTFFKSFADTDLAWLRYVIFIEPIAVSLNEAISFNSELFMNTVPSSTSSLKQKSKTISCSLKNISSQAFWCIENLMTFNLMTCRMKISSFSQNYRVSTKRFIHNKV
jgi:hypothetical protein